MAGGVNKVILVGNLGKDPEIRAMENGRKVANFTLATTESYKDRNGERVDQTEWHNVQFWGPIAEVIERYLKKGSKIYVEGKIKTRSYEQDGVKKYITEIVGQNMTMLDSAGRSNGETFSQERSVASPSAAPSSMAAIEAPQEEDDLPF